MDIKPPNFQFLKDLDPTLMNQVAMAERYCLDDPSASLGKLRLFGELLAKNIAARMGVYTDSTFEQVKILREKNFATFLIRSLRICFTVSVLQGMRLYTRERAP
jgi:type I restriction enzyme R subunit